MVVLRSTILGVKAVLAGWDLHQLKAHPSLHKYQCNVLLYLPPFGHNAQRDRQSDRNRPHILQNRRPNKLDIASFIDNILVISCDVSLNFLPQISRGIIPVKYRYFPATFRKYCAAGNFWKFPNSQPLVLRYCLLAG